MILYSKDGNTRFTTVPLKPLSDQICGRYCRFSSFKVFNSVHSFPVPINLYKNPKLKKPGFKIINSDILIVPRVEHQALSSMLRGSVEVTLTVPLRFNH